MSCSPELIHNIRNVTHQQLWHTDMHIHRCLISDFLWAAIHKDLRIYLCIYIYVPEPLRCHVPGVVDVLRRAGHLFEFVYACFYTLKDSVPVDLHYMTDRLQRVKNLRLCFTEETKSPTSTCPGVSRQISHFHFWVNYTFKVCAESSKTHLHFIVLYINLK